MHWKNLLLLSLLLGFTLSAGEPVFAQRKKSPPKVWGSPGSGRFTVKALTPEAQRRLETFQKVWQVISDYYFDPTFNNLNWTAIKTEYEPRVRVVKTDAELHRLLHEMINRLGRSHLAIIPPEVYREIERAKFEAKTRQSKQKAALLAGKGAEELDEDELNFDDPLAQYGIGVDLRMMNNQFVITRINQNAAAEYAGLKTGFVIEKINDVSLADMVLRISVYYAASPEIMRLLPAELVHSFLNGEKDSTVDITYLDESDQRKEVTIRRELVKSQTISIGKNFPDQQLEFETASLNDETGYIRFNEFALPVIEKVCASLSLLKNKKALIIDLRGNTGGVMASMVGLSGMLSDTVVDLGTSIYKSREEKLSATPKAKNFKGRLVFLVDGSTISAAEMFAASFQENGRALVVGDKTAGASLPSMVVELPTGAVMQYPIANYRSGKGAFLEGTGVTPNYPVALDRKSLAAGRDLQLEKALSLIKENTAFPEIKKIPDYIGPRNTGLSSGWGPPPPPPPPRAMPKPPPAAVGKVLAEVTIKAPLTQAVKADPPIREPAAVKIINDFIAGIGGREQLEKVRSYIMEGNAGLIVRGSVQDFDYAVYRQAPDKYAEIMSSPSTGEIREVYSGKNSFTQADYGFLREMPVAGDTSDIDILAPIRAIIKEDSFPSLKYVGTYERDGRKVHLIDGKSKDGAAVALAFDVETKMLSYFTGPYFGMIFGDYRKTGEMTLPFRIEREHLMRLQFDEIKLNVPVDESKFVKKINCYDLPN